MPGPASHLTIIELQTTRAENDPQTFGGPVLDALANHKKHAALGAIGPDMIFWADWGEYTPIVNTIFDIYKTIDEVYEALAAIWQPIGDAIDKVVNTLTGGLAGEIAETVNLLRGVIESALIKLITEQIDVLAFLKPDMQSFGSQSRIKDWNWLDYTHHRWTGDFGKALVRRAHQTSDPALRAYALGWLSHVTADVVGHPYV
ncbi:MAG: zinc dependent phospholipase C family protein, partial [Acidobacteria bacterium]|nr:zinc dependent phospholipase C family protein [Acidobacteriota bacterium]